VSVWLSAFYDGSRAAGPAGETLRRIEASAPGERTAWLGEYFAAVRDCRLERIKAP